MTAAVLDANVLLRFVTWDDPAKGAATEELLMQAGAGSVSLRMSALAVAEVVWVLEKFYRWPKADIASRLAPLLALPGLVVEHTSVIGDALTLHARENIDFIDAYQGLWALANGVPDIYSYDRHLDRITGLNRHEP